MHLACSPALLFFLVAALGPAHAEVRILLEESFDRASSLARLFGDVSIIDFGKLEHETTGKTAGLNSAGSNHQGAVTFRVSGLADSEGKWFRFSFRGLPGKDFLVKGRSDLAMHVRFFGKNGAEPLDGVVKEIYEDIEKDRQDIDVNGDLRRYGSSVWTTYVFEFRLPFNNIDTLEFSVDFRNGGGHAPYGTFFVDDVKLQSIDRETVASTTRPPFQPIDPAQLSPLGGHWFYLRRQGELSNPRHFDSSNFARLAYRTGDSWEFPFAQNQGTWLRQGFKDAEGRLIKADEWITNPVQVDFEAHRMVIHSYDIPNHPTAIFPGYLGNRSYIQQQDVVVYLPLEPQPNPNAIAMTKNNSNYGLQMGPTGIAVNGVVFYNPFDANMAEAVNIMDRCCGHPDPRNRYHYHKYPVCSRSPFEDQGGEHSPLIGWAFDGFPVYGPYEGNGEMAMDSKANPLNAFNAHRDEARGWHYHVTPGRFPYIIGGYWGHVDRQNFQRPLR